MVAILLSFFAALGSALCTRGDLVLENLALRQQLAVFKRRDPRPRLTHPEQIVEAFPEDTAITLAESIC
jgi:hypothetical protein